MKNLKNTKFAKKIWATLSTAVMSVMFALPASAEDAGGWNSIISFGNNIAENLKSIAKVAAVIATIVLGITLITHRHQGWGEVLKGGFCKLIIGIMIISYGTGIVTGLFA